MSWYDIVKVIDNKDETPMFVCTDKDIPVLAFIPFFSIVPLGT